MLSWPVAAIMALAVMLATACSTARSPSGTTATPRGLKKIDSAALKTVLDTASREMLVPGALVYLRTPQGDFTVSYGSTVLGAASPPSLDTHFRIASNTKTMTAALILQLAQEGLLGLDDPVSKYIAGVPNGSKITIAQLLEMRSGLYNYTNAREVADRIDRDGTAPWTPEQVLAIAFARPPNFPPGTAFEYNNTNYALLGRIAEKAGGKPLAQAMRDRLFAPLHMRHTELPASGVTAIPEPYSHGYLYGGSSVALSDDAPAYSSKMQADARAGTLLPNDYTNANHSFAGAAGGVISTAGDLAIWARALANGSVLDAAYQRRWLDSPQPEDPGKPGGQEYGYGIARIKWGPNTMYFHGGETVGFNSFMGYDIENQVALIIWTNLTVSLDRSPTANALMLKVLDQIYAASPL